MNPDEAPVGTICSVGHSMNGVVARKNETGTWIVLNTGRELDYDSVHKSMNIIWVPVIPKKCHWCDEEHELGKLMFLHVRDTHSAQLEAEGIVLSSDPPLLRT